MSNPGRVALEVGDYCIQLVSAALEVIMPHEAGEGHKVHAFL
jgi:hypothetical protein